MPNRDDNPLNEFSAAAEFMALHSSPVLHGRGLPQGDGTAVLVIPGLFGNDHYLSTFRTWLARIGYKPLASDIGWNVGCPRRLLKTIEAAIERANLKPDAKISIVGHSRGGLLAKALASNLGSTVRSLITVGSPLGAILSAGPAGMQTYTERMRVGSRGQQSLFNASRGFTKLIDPDCTTPHCDCEYSQALFAPLDSGVNVVSIFSRDDPIVTSSSSVMAFGRNVEVSGSHGGLMFNEAVYPHIAEALAQ